MKFSITISEDFRAEGHNIIRIQVHRHIEITNDWEVDQKKEKKGRGEG